MNFWYELVRPIAVCSCVIVALDVTPKSGVHIDDVPVRVRVARSIDEEAERIAILLFLVPSIIILCDVDDGIVKWRICYQLPNSARQHFHCGVPIRAIVHKL